MCCNSFIYWHLRRCPLKSLLERSWRHLERSWRPRFFSITDFYHYDLMHPINNFCTPLSAWVGPRKSVSNRAPHLLTPALVVVIEFITLTYHCYVTDNWIQHKFEIGPSRKARAFNYHWKCVGVRMRRKAVNRHPICKLGLTTKIF